jgi:competence protein ComEA
VAGLAVLALLVCLLAGALVLRSRPRLVVPPTVEQSGVPVPGARVGTQPGTSSASPGAAPAGTASPRATAAAARVVVAVAGAVRRPGLVSLPTGSRVDDAVRAAGGLAPGGRLGLLNLARRLVDGEQVLVGVTAPDPAPGAGGAASAAADDAAGSAAPVDLNTATAAQLDALPGIGPVLAQRIVDHRTQDGPFRSVEDLRQVSGIGAAKFASLRSSVTV